MNLIPKAFRKKPENKKRSINFDSFALSYADSDSLSVLGYSRLIDSPDVGSAVGKIADIVSDATIHLMRNTPDGDKRVKNELSKFMDIHPYSLGTRKTLISWIVEYMLTAGDGNAFVLPVTENGYLADLLPMPGATITGINNDTSYVVRWKGSQFQPDEVLHFVYRPSVDKPWKGQGIRLMLKDVLDNLKQAAATTNAFLSDKWKPSVIVKVDAIAEEFADEDGRKTLVDAYIRNQEAGRPWIIPSEFMEVEQIKPLSLSDLAINNNVQLDKKTVAAVIGVPAFFLGVGTYNQDEYNNFIRTKIKPLATGIQLELTKKLLISPDMYFRFNSRKLYSYSLTDLAKVGDDQYVRGIMTGNEVRDWIELSPAEGLDEFVMLENYIPAGMIGDQKKLDNKEGEINE